MTHSCFLDLVRDCDKELLVLGSVLASNQNFDWESAAFQLVKVLGYGDSSAAA
jgi:hypothetical protein